MRCSSLGKSEIAKVPGGEEADHGEGEVNHHLGGQFDLFLSGCCAGSSTFSVATLLSLDSCLSFGMRAVTLQSRARSSWRRSQTWQTLGGLRVGTRGQHCKCDDVTSGEDQL